MSLSPPSCFAQFRRFGFALTSAPERPPRKEADPLPVEAVTLVVNGYFGCPLHLMKLGRLK